MRVCGLSHVMTIIIQSPCNTAVHPQGCFQVQRVRKELLCVITAQPTRVCTPFFPPSTLRRILQCTAAAAPQSQAKSILAHHGTFVVGWALAKVGCLRLARAESLRCVRCNGNAGRAFTAVEWDQGRGAPPVLTARLLRRWWEQARDALPPVSPSCQLRIPSRRQNITAL